MTQRNLLALWIAFFVIACAPLPAPADAGEASQSQPSASQPATDSGRTSDEINPAAIEKASVTEGKVTVSGKTLNYQTTTANMVMRDDEGQRKGTIFFVAYEKKKDATSSTSPADADLERSVPGSRPITFVFNGGPGAAAVWLHLGTAGPRRIELNGEGLPIGPPYQLLDNPNTWLDMTDLVFIDPVGTGFSRPEKGEKHEEFFGVKQDINWVAEFIRLYTTRYNRWLSPKFVAGESYGTTRAAGMSEYLIDRYGIALNGIILISSVLDFQTLRFADNNDLPYVLYLPSYTAVAWYHHRLDDSLQADLTAARQQAETWALSTYALALAKGESLPAEQRQAIVRDLARYTALPAEVIEENNLRITPWVFRKQLLHPERMIVGRMDARLKGYDPELAAEWPSYDPGLPLHMAAYSAAFNDYARRILKFDSLLPYEILSDKVYPWKYGESGQGYLFVADNLRSALVKNPNLKIFFASGYFDLATPYFATDYTISHLRLTKALRQNIYQCFYNAGHMMYHNWTCQEKLKNDVSSFVHSAYRSCPVGDPAPRP